MTRRTDWTPEQREHHEALLQAEWARVHAAGGHAEFRSTRCNACQAERQPSSPRTGPVVLACTTYPTTSCITS